MKKLIIFSVLFALSVTIASAQVSFSFQAGNNYNKTIIGYKANKFVPYIGVQLLHFGFTDEYEDYLGNKHKDEGSINLLMPNIGVKAFLIDKESIKGGMNAGLYKPVFSGNAKNDGTENEEFKKALKETKLFLGEFGFFAEYFLSDNFSVGGEFGFRLASFKSDIDEFADISKAKFDATYTAFTANFYF